MTTYVAEIKLSPELTRHICHSARRWSWWGAYRNEEDEPVTWIFERDEECLEDPRNNPGRRRHIDWGKGFQAMADGDLRVDLGMFNLEEEFSDSADRFLQVCVFGAVIYG